MLNYVLLQLLDLMDQYQCNSSTITNRIFLDRCQFCWSYFPVWMLFLERACMCIRWMRDKRPRLIISDIRLIVNKERYLKLGITCCVYYQPLIEATCACAHTATSLICSLHCVELFGALLLHYIFIQKTTRKRIIIINDNRNGMEWNEKGLTKKWNTIQEREKI